MSLYLYCSPADISANFGNRFIFGTSGSCIMGTGHAGTIIANVSSYIDFELTHVYGTTRPLFGTNEWGTSDIPNEIKTVAVYLSAGMIMKNTWQTITEETSKWADEKYMWGSKFLDKIAGDFAFLSPFNGTVETDQTMWITNEYGTKIGETFTLNASPHMIDNRKIIKGDTPPVVYGTRNGVMGTYAEGTHYTIQYWLGDMVGKNYGYITGVGTTSADVCIDYVYLIGPIFKLRDSFHWGESQKENR